MTDLATRLLASIDAHGRCRVDGIYQLYCHETKDDIIEALKELQGDGWVKLTMHTVQIGPTKKEKKPFNVSRTKKQLYSEQLLFNLESA